ncbi:MAG: hypothetical protein RL181_1018, partial [Bacteroidota bacterium]
LWLPLRLPVRHQHSTMFKNKENHILLLLAVIQFSDIMDFMIIMPLGPQFMRVFGISPQQFSLIVSIYAASAFAMSLFSAAFVDRFDRKTALLFVYTGFTIGTLLCSVADGYYLFLAARAITGAFGGLLGALVLSAVSDLVPFERRASAMGMVMTAFSVASVAGVPLGVFLAAQFSWRAPFLVIGGFALLVLAGIAFLFPSMKGHHQHGEGRLSPLDVFSGIVRDGNQLRALAFSVVLMLGHFSIIPFIAPYMQLNIGFSDHQVSYVYLAGGLASVVVLPTVGRMADRHGNGRVFLLATVFALFVIFTITHLPAVPMAIALLATTAFFVASGGRNVPATTMVTSVVSPERRGGFMSVRASANELGLALASFIAGLIVTRNPDGSLAHYNRVGYFAIAMSILAALLASRLKRRD